MTKSLILITSLFTLSAHAAGGSIVSDGKRGYFGTLIQHASRGGGIDGSTAHEIAIHLQTAEDYNLITFNLRRDWGREGEFTRCVDFVSPSARHLVQSAIEHAVAANKSDLVQVQTVFSCSELEKKCSSPDLICD